ncbi:MAG: GTPase HflX, partial [candidate division NC10 bacterium]
MIDTHGSPERAVLVTRRSPKQTRWEVQESLAELARLTASAGAVVVGNLSQDGPSRSPRLYLGKGKVEELRAL